MTLVVGIDLTTTATGSEVMHQLTRHAAVCVQRIARVAAGGGMPTLRPLLRHLRLLNKSLAFGRQEDTHEFFYSLVNTMETILLKEAGGKERFSLRWGGCSGERVHGMVCLHTKLVGVLMSIGWSDMRW